MKARRSFLRPKFYANVTIRQDDVVIEWDTHDRKRAVAVLQSALSAARAFPVKIPKSKNRN